MSRPPLLSARFADLLREYLRSRDIDPEPIIRVPVIRQVEGEEFVSLLAWVQALHHIAEVTGNPAVGLEIGAQIRPRHLGVAGYLMAHCANAGEMLVRMLHFGRLFLNRQDMGIRIDGSDFVLEWHPGKIPVNQIWADLRASAVVSFCRNVTGLHDQPVRCVEYALPAPPALKPYEDFYRGEVLFDRSLYAMRVGVDVVTSPLIDPDPALVEVLDEKAEKLLSRTQSVGRLDETLYPATVHAINAREPGAESVAARLHCSRRTLNRRVSKLGKTFQQVQDECRLELAQSYLKDRQLSLSDITELLGYSEQAAFTRAFKRWTGRTPAQFRRQVTGVSA